MTQKSIIKITEKNVKKSLWIIIMPTEKKFLKKERRKDLRVKVGNCITVYDYNSDILEWCWNNLVLPNPEFYKKEKMGHWVGNTPREIYLYEKNGNNLVLPFGCLRYIWNKYKKTCVFERRIVDLRHFNYCSNIKLYDYQERAVNCALKQKNGVIVMPCGAGKTQTALEIIARIGGKALWLTHTKDLMNQSLNRAKSVYELPNSAYGTITDGKVNISNGITFATVQTMSKLDLTRIKDYWDVIIVDECHKAIGSPTKVMQFYKVLSNLSCRYKFGVTATPKRADGLDKSMYCLIGDKIIEITKEEIKHTICNNIQVKFIETGYIPNPDNILMGDGTINYASLSNDLTHDEERFQKVLDTILNLPKGQPILVLGNRVEYLQKLCEKYNESNPDKAVCLSGMGVTKYAKEQRKKALTSLNNCEINCVFATYQLAKEGLDVPNLRYLVFSTPEKDETTVTQAAGRVARKFDGKDVGFIIDFVDNFGMYNGWKKKREGYYKKLDYYF